MLKLGTQLVVENDKKGFIKGRSNSERGTEGSGGKLVRIPYRTATPNPKKESQGALQSQKIPKFLRMEKT